MSTTTKTPEFATLREKIAYEKAERLARYARFAEIFADANKAGWEAHEAALPQPMVVEEVQPLTGVPTGKQWHVAEGLCGFAWVTVRPGSSSFARWLVKQGHARSSYQGGVMIWVSTQTQSYDRKTAFAQAMAAVFTEAPELAGLRIFPGGRLD